MMPWATIAIVIGLAPLARATWKNRSNTLVHALIWAIAAWFSALASTITGSSLGMYLCLCLIACAGVSVLGARKPGAGPWHAVVAGLLAVLLMPVAEGLGETGIDRIDRIRLWFLGLILTIGVANYVPTRIGLGAAVLWMASAMVLRSLLVEVSESERLIGFGLMGLSPWLAWAGMLRGNTDLQCDREWIAFRDHYGFVWAQRIREQFNRSSANSNWDVCLSWSGLRRMDGLPPTQLERAAAAELLRSLMSRFGLFGP